MMLSFDSADLGFGALIQLVKSKTADGFIPNWATPQHKRTWSQPPIASRVLHEMVMKHKNSNTSWVVELLFDDLLDWNQWFNEQRRLLPLNITCLGGPDRGSKGMQEGRWESEYILSYMIINPVLLSLRALVNELHRACLDCLTIRCHCRL